MPRERPVPAPFEPEWLDRSLDRYLIAGLVFMAVLIGGFGAYRAREPDLRATALREQQVTYTALGRQLFADGCASCHGDGGEGGDAPTLNAREFLESVSDGQMQLLVAGGVSGSGMPAWSIDFGGTLTEEQIRQVVTYMRSWEPDAPSIPDWRQGGGGDHHDD